MEYRFLGRSGLKVSVLSLGAATFGGGNEFFRAWGQVDDAGASRKVDMCLDAGVNLVDVANNYSTGLAEEVLGKASLGRRDRVLISTKFRIVLVQTGHGTLEAVSPDPDAEAKYDGKKADLTLPSNQPPAGAAGLV